jgi:hypothetical protein
VLVHGHHPLDQRLIREQRRAPVGQIANQHAAAALGQGTAQPRLADQPHQLPCCVQHREG